MTASKQSTVQSGGAGKASSSSVMAGNKNWDGAGGMDQITVVRIDDTHIAEEESHVDGKVFYEVECSLPAEDEVVGEDDDDGVYVIEYSNPEEEGESYQFTMSVDRSLPAKEPIVKTPVVSENPGALLPSRPARLRPQVSQKRRLVTEEEEIKSEEFTVSNKSVLALGEDYSDVMEMNSGSGKKLVCTMCPPPGKLFKRASGLAVHLKQMHHMEGKKTFFCNSCQQSLRTQIELDAHTRRHANQDAVFVCRLCAAEEEAGTEEKKGFKGSRWGLKKHLEKEHPGVIPRCDICNKGFKTLVSYLADQFRHVGVSPYYCAKCQIYEMTERGLSVHIRNHNKKKMTEQKANESRLQTFEVSAGADNSATDDSDF
ncbi:zinc finger protein 615-like isoform X1 [Simochromis diagramma]|nr:zinc finger protein 615-like isoform X1 [Simochromis diagramma]